MTGLACVTGATGLVGGWIVDHLLKQGHSVRVLSRQESTAPKGVEIWSGALDNPALLQEFVDGANAVFHCAAEIHDEKLMYKTNVEGTRNLLAALQDRSTDYFCHISSAGVVGPVSMSEVNEDTPCSPDSEYERSKYAAEQLVADAELTANVCILRPTNVYDAHNPGILALSLRHSLMDRFKLFLKGNENAHLVHASDVAAAALYFWDKPLLRPQIYLVSCDSDERNTVAGACKLFESIRDGRRSARVFALPRNLSYLARGLVKGKRMHGRVRFSAEKLHKAGFVFPLGFEQGLTDVGQLLSRQSLIDPAN